jgi:outer membrane biosynthesis protein TonB
MQYLFDLVRAREGDIARRRVEFALVLSLLLHGVAMWAWLPHTPQIKPGDMTTREDQPLSLRLVPSPRATPEPPPAVMREAPPKQAMRPTPPRRAAPPPPATPPVIAVPAPAPAPPVAVTPPSPPVAAPPVPAPPAMAGDLASYIAERRRARGEIGEAPATVDSETQRRERAIASNLASLQTSTFGNAPQNGGGTFQIRRLDFDEAQFTFYGWNRDINRRTFQVIDVRRGAEATINVAIVRRIIAIIREHETADFRWDSKRLGRDLMLSARLSDNAELEAFLMQEFFIESGRPR